MNLTKAQRIMVEDGLPAKLLLTQDQRAAAWRPYLELVWTHSFKDPANEQQRAIREQHKREAAALRIRKLKAGQARKAVAVKPATIRGKRWDSRNNKWVPINPTEPRMNTKDDTKPESEVLATTDADTLKPVASNEDTKMVTTKSKKSTAKKPTKAKKAAKGKKVAKAAKKANGVKKSNGAKKRTPREGNKTQDVLAKMRTAKGITRAEILDMTGWKAVSVQQLVKAQGLNPDKDLKISEERPFSYRLAK